MFINNLKKYAKIDKLKFNTNFKMTIFVYATIITAYTILFHERNDLIYLQYWLLISIIINFALQAINVGNNNKNFSTKNINAKKIIHSAKIFYSLYMGNVYSKTVAFSENIEVCENYLYVTNLIQTYTMLIIFIELAILLGNAMDYTKNYNKIKNFYVLTLYIIICSIISVQFVFYDNKLEFWRKTKRIDDFTFVMSAYVVFTLIAILWCLKERERKGFYEMNITKVQNSDVPPTTNNNQNSFKHKDVPPPTYSDASKLTNQVYSNILFDMNEIKTYKV
ncbi:ac124 [Oxyplax ochracea nucleopolyhedrovirus]|uniref:Ac124 n=1 Tax=Oxyplax ochracea nucleopolyhedrovirus TaxID=2083176 RepID=A0A2L0WU04_9ABAC|nr:ac124 [Oxyplax ochracea nucleopolyhedrovirus]AVA31125.1 ac124 [Oxyplax ochracea nucleopolyhedrovirus]